MHNGIYATLERKSLDGFLSNYQQTYKLSYNTDEKEVKFFENQLYFGNKKLIKYRVKFKNRLYDDLVQIRLKTLRLKE